jgi:hypothetical protein
VSLYPALCGDLLFFVFWRECFLAEVIAITTVEVADRANGFGHDIEWRAQVIIYHKSISCRINDIMYLIYSLYMADSTFKCNGVNFFRLIFHVHKILHFPYGLK